MIQRWRETSRALRITIAVCAGLITVGIVLSALTVFRPNNPSKAVSLSPPAGISPVAVAVASGTGKASAKASKSPSSAKTTKARTANHPTSSAEPKSSSGQGGSGGNSGGSGSGAGSGGGGGSGSGNGSYVSPGSQGYRGATADLAVYSAANGRTPGKNCSWNTSDLYLLCSGTSLSLDHVYIEGGLYWSGCGSLNIANSVIDWHPSRSWFVVQDACTSPNAGTAITVSASTFEAGPGGMVYSGGSDIGGISEFTNTVPMFVSNSLFEGLPQGLDPGAGSVVKDNEIYTPESICNHGTYHCDGLFSQGGNNITYQGNYIDVAPSSTAAIFYQSSPNSNGNKVIGNFLQGGSYSLYNENSNGLDVESNTFGSNTYGYCSLSGSASWRTWNGNAAAGGAQVTPSGVGCR
jgi:hypothetical protein